MKIAIISDVHNNFHNLTKVLKDVKKRGVEQIIFLGDFGSNGIARFLANFPIPVSEIVWS